MIKDKIYKYFLDQEKQRETRDGITFAPSYINDCKRKIYYKKTGEEVSNPISEASYFKMALGTSSHDKIQSIINEIGVLQECEDLKEIDWQGLKWFYRLDGILEIENKKMILEIKTVYSAGFRAIEYEPKTEHLIQMYLYMVFEKIENGVLLYVGRDNGFMIEYVYNLTDLNKLFKSKVLSKIDELKKLKTDIESNNMPGRDFQIQLKNTGDAISEMFTKDKVKYKTFWVCNYCQYKNLCWKDVYKKIKDHKFYINGKFLDD